MLRRPSRPLTGGGQDAKKGMYYIGCVLLFLALIGIDSLVRVTGKAIGGPLLVAAASFVCGGLIGFLFGIPRAQEAAANGPAAGEIRYRQSTNTNLEQISDWLTKIIVGLGLVNLRSIPAKLESLGRKVATDIAAFGSPSFAIAAILTFAGIGFLFAYLGTRIYISLVFVQAKREEELAEMAREAERASSQEKEQAMRTPVAPELLTTTADQQAAGQRIPDTLVELADRYLAVQSADKQQRVQEKNDLSAQLGRLVNSGGIDRDSLANSTSEGLWMALVSAIQLDPHDGDYERLKLIAPKLTRLHTRYRATLALAELAKAKLVPAGAAQEADRLLLSLREGADAPLMRIVDSTRALVSRTAVG